ncbi:MAG: M24 family metallopeptidase [Promethearchaeota archaeon]
MVNSRFDFGSRLKKVMELIEYNNFDYILITNIQNLYWLSGTAQYGVLLIHKENEPILFIRRNFFKAQKETILKNIFELKKTSQIYDFIKKVYNSPENLKIGMELNSLPTSYFLYYQNMLKGAEIVNIEPELRELRMEKDLKELKIHREAGKIAEKVQKVIMNNLRIGISEYELAAEVMYESMKNKGLHFSIVNGMLKNWFIVASGKNLWIPSYFPILSGKGFSNAIPYGYSERKIKQKDIVICDYGLIFNGYHADHARTYYVETIPNLFKERYLLLKRIYQEVVNDYLRAGNPVNLIYNKIKEMLGKEGLDKFFEGDGYYFQGLGHGIGLELDEPPFFVENNHLLLKENMVISLEPKIIIPNWGAINFEDNFIVKKGRPEQITNSPYLFE